MSHIKIKDLQNQDRPREKLIMMGADYLTDSELLAIMLRTGGKNRSATDIAKELLNKFKGLRNLLLADYSSIRELPHVGDAKTACIKAVGETCKRINNPIKHVGTLVEGPKDVFEFIKKDLIDKDKEHLYLLSLNSRSKVISKDLITIGTLNETLIHPREIFKKSLINKASSIILIHNHPSQESEPSRADIQVTQRVYKAGILIGIPLIDHVITTNTTYYSMKEKNLLSNINLTEKEGD